MMTRYLLFISLVGASSFAASEHTPIKTNSEDAPAHPPTPIGECQQLLDNGDNSYQRSWAILAKLAPLNTAATQTSYYTQAEQGLQQELPNLSLAQRLAIAARYLEALDSEEASYLSNYGRAVDSNATLCTRALKNLGSTAPLAKVIQLLQGPVLNPSETAFDQVLRQSFGSSYARRRSQALRDFYRPLSSFNHPLPENSITKKELEKEWKLLRAKYPQLPQWEADNKKILEANRNKRHGLSDLEITAIHGYTMDDYYELNDALRKPGPLNPSLRPYVELLNQALTKLPAWKSPTVTRYAVGPLPNQVLAHEKPGLITTYPAYTSTSTSPLISTSSSLSVPDETVYIYTIKQKSGRFVGQFSHSPDETEVLFKPGTRFHVTKVKMSPNKKIVYIDMEEVGTKP